MTEDEPGADLRRFLEAQERSYSQALDELQKGRKLSHWMWYIFPQLEGLGRSATARYFALKSREEARAYLAHPVLGERLQETTRAVLSHRERSLSYIFGQPDDIKFRSSMTLFVEAGDPAHRLLFQQALDIFCEGQPDETTLRLLKG